MQNVILAAISGNNAINVLLTVIIVGVIFGILFWVINAVGLPEPFAKIARVILILVAVIFLINALLALVGHGFIVW